MIKSGMRQHTGRLPDGIGILGSTEPVILYPERFVEVHFILIRRYK